jgi:DNA polymerase-3 subunit gamma/tau
MIIVDDIDMISEQCQQVFRNYIDKHKNNVIFVAACSNIQKVIESIQSRINIIRIQKPTDDDMKSIVNKIIIDEKINISEATRDYIIQFSNRSIRDTINHLEKIYILGDNISSEIKLDQVKKICSTISFQQFEEYVQHIKSNNMIKAIECLYEIHDYGYSVIDILDYFFTFINLSLLVIKLNSIVSQQNLLLSFIIYSSLFNPNYIFPSYSFTYRTFVFSHNLTEVIYIGNPIKLTSVFNKYFMFR